MTEDETSTQGLTRRELLKRGAVIGGALAWATPAVQLIGMTPALANHVSGSCFCVKNDPPGSSNFEALSDSSDECLDPLDEGCNDLPPLPFDPAEFEVVDNGGSFTIKIPANCNLLAVTIKCGGGAPGEDGCDHPACFCYTELTLDSTCDSGRKCFTVDDLECKDQPNSISHIEFCIQC